MEADNGRTQTPFRGSPTVIFDADNGDSVNLPRWGKRVLADYAAGTGGDFIASMAGVNSGYPRLE
jgi:hypothetical protein